MASRTARIVASTVAPILLTGGIAVAASKSSDDPDTTTTPQTQNGQAPQGQPPQGPPMGRPPGPPGPGMDRNLTFGELHVRRDGKDVVIRLDRGKVKSTTETSITITNNTGADVEIPVDGDTKILGGPRKNKTNLKVTDLKAGQQVTVDREAGKAANVIALMPKRGAHPPRPPMGPPPGPGQNGPQGQNGNQGQYGQQGQNGNQGQYGQQGQNQPGSNQQNTRSQGSQ